MRFNQPQSLLFIVVNASSENRKLRFMPRVGIHLDARNSATFAPVRRHLIERRLFVLGT